MAVTNKYRILINKSTNNNEDDLYRILFNMYGLDIADKTFKNLTNKEYSNKEARQKLIDNNETDMLNFKTSVTKTLE